MVNFKKIKKWDAVCITWVDSSSYDSWCSTEDALARIEQPLDCWTIGFYIGESTETIVIASNRSFQDNVDLCMYIPKVAVKHIAIWKTP